MAWWDNEELKAYEDRSERYKNMFPEEYKSSKKTERVVNSNTAKYDLNKPAFVAIRKDGMEHSLFLYSQEELFSFLSDNKQKEWKFYRVGDEVEVKTSIVSVNTPVYRSSEDYS